MTKRLDFSKANRERKMRTQGVEGIDGPGTAEQARKGYRDVINERNKDPERAPGGSSHSLIKDQARTDFEAKKAGTWDIVDASIKLTLQAAKRADKKRPRRHRKGK
ncbi:hypothetical protein AUC68_04770 [Methyloceanibacter methanicus]|uniref:Uncharacterized protein n=1 Tax=Methyloceanibacter methanicus TaxID=1774968 RepID=A0A1E3W0M1_9HYPH|nr:hypothetical protein [Methyloceanibacter methanicus]ODR99309.1 hypothetical protein AUC68_04770 [Methyloceanibacter methanicus]